MKEILLKRLVALGGLAAIVLAAVHCSGPRQSSASASHPAAVTVEATATSSEPSWVEAPPSETDELPPVPDASNEEKLAFLSTICRVASTKRDGKREVGCTTCPPFEGPDARPDGTVTTDAETVYTLVGLKFGAFTETGAEEAAATFNGCESHAANYGGTLLARREAGSWNAVRYDSGVRPDACLTHRTSEGRDVLICSWSDGHQSNFHTQILTYDFNGQDIQSRWGEVVTIDDSSSAGCLGLPPGRKVVAGRVAGFAVRLEQGKSKLLVDVDYAEAEPSAAYKAACDRMYEAIEADSTQHVDPAEALGPMRRYRLRFEERGETFEATPATRALPMFAGAPKR